MKAVPLTTLAAKSGWSSPAPVSMTQTRTAGEPKSFEDVHAAGSLTDLREYCWAKRGSFGAADTGGGATETFVTEPEMVAVAVLGSQNSMSWRTRRSRAQKSAGARVTSGSSKQNRSPMAGASRTTVRPGGVGGKEVGTSCDALTRTPRSTNLSVTSRAAGSGWEVVFGTGAGAGAGAGAGVGLGSRVAIRASTTARKHTQGIARGRRWSGIAQEGAENGRGARAGCVRAEAGQGREQDGQERDRKHGRYGAFGQGRGGGCMTEAARSR